MIYAICERLKPVLCTQRTCVVREGDPVNEMLFIIRGNLDSYTTNGGRTGFFNTFRIGPGDFCGEELLTWALNPCPSVILPSSTRTVKAVSEVESFALVTEDIKFVEAQFWRLHSKHLRHKFSGKLDMTSAPSPGSGVAEYAARWAASRRGHHKHTDSDSIAVSSLQKPEEPDFSVDV
ncbi:hypothetical protein K7X08_003284 [Anisodus acutangulus]|uniref:Cyclic nucleotide-binding domain-containing protein n=1 Tax=Anisodus acutangulus TaxID=402998 RepID=A0A9Q1MF33_9SOLA|nr:hypothetical protein K7X08_003284 [Anisodus acutangulus]